MMDGNYNSRAEMCCDLKPSYKYVGYHQICVLLALHIPRSLMAENVPIHASFEALRGSLLED